MRSELKVCGQAAGKVLFKRRTEIKLEISAGAAYRIFQSLKHGEYLQKKRPSRAVVDKIEKTPSHKASLCRITALVVSVYLVTLGLFIRYKPFS